MILHFSGKRFFVSIQGANVFFTLPNHIKSVKSTCIAVKMCFPENACIGKNYKSVQIRLYSNENELGSDLAFFAEADFR